MPPFIPLAAPGCPVHYQVQAQQVHAHLFDVCMHLASPEADQVVSLPAWIPGSYLVREFAKNLQGLSATQNGQAIALTQTSKNSWRLACSAGTAVQLHYQVCAYDTSVRTAWLDQRRGFFNGTSLFLRAHGHEDQAHGLQLLASAATADWAIATGLSPVDVDAQGWGQYRAGGYDELVDCPVEMGHFWQGQFMAGGVPHRLVVSGAAASFDSARLLSDTQKICEAELALWHGDGSPPPMQQYVFLLNVVDDGYGGLEHLNSTALICARRDLPRLGESKTSEAYTTLLGLISHEYFHTWNVKRLRPAEFARYDYEAENYTELLWFFEGFTSYYDDLLLRRAGLIDNKEYLKLITRTINQVQQTPGRHVQSVAQASFDAWVKYYRQDENTANHTVSYYTKGSLVALCLDLTLRHEGRTTLDAVMQALWQRCSAGPMREADLLDVLAQLAGRSLEAEIAQWVHGKTDLPVAQLLGRHGVTARVEPPQPAQRLGLRVVENHSVMVKTVLHGGLAEQAGMMAGDEWLAIELAATAEAPAQRWRISRLDDLALYAGTAVMVTAWVARDRQLLALPLCLQSGTGPQAANGDANTANCMQAISNLGLEITDASAVERWLSSSGQKA